MAIITDLGYFRLLAPTMLEVWDDYCEERTGVYSWRLFYTPEELAYQEDGLRDWQHDVGAFFDSFTEGGDAQCPRSPIKRARGRK